MDAGPFFRRLRGDLVHWAGLRARTNPGSLLADCQRQLSPSMPCRISGYLTEPRAPNLFPVADRIGKREAKFSV